MKIGIEGQRLFRRQKAGMDIVTLELIRNLQHLDTQNEYVVFVKPDEDSGCVKETSNFKIVELEGSNYLTWEQIALPKAVKAHGVDLLHCTNNTAPYYCPVPTVLTLHDIIFLENLKVNSRGTLYQQMGKIYRKNLVPRIIHKCEKIITVSNQEKTRILNYFHINDSKVEVIYNGVGPEFRVVQDQELLNRVKSTYNLPDQFILFLGNLDPKKNMGGALEAFGRYAEGKEDARMVLTAIKPAVLEQLLATLNRPELAEKIILPGFVPFEYLPTFYTLATVYMYPSLREGFGLPILEAFGCGTPVITANTSSMPEIGGEAAVLVDPEDPGKLSNAIRMLMEDKCLRERHIKAGFERVKAFSWEKMAVEVQKIYQSFI